MGVGFEEVALLDASGWIVLLDAVDYGGLNGAPAGRFLDVSGWVGVLFPNPTRRAGCRPLAAVEGVEAREQ